MSCKISKFSVQALLLLAVLQAGLVDAGVLLLGACCLFVCTTGTAPAAVALSTVTAGGSIFAGAAAAHSCTMGCTVSLGAITPIGPVCTVAAMASGPVVVL